MNIKQYSKEVIEKLDSLSDEEFEQLLIESGIEKCPVLPDYDEVVTFQARGDDVEMISAALEYIPTNREDVWSYLCYLRNEISR